MRNLKSLTTIIAIAIIATMMIKCNSTPKTVETPTPKTTDTPTKKTVETPIETEVPDIDGDGASLVAIVYPRLPGESDVPNPCAELKQGKYNDANQFKMYELILNEGTILCDMTPEQINKANGYDPVKFCDCLAAHCDEKQSNPNEFIECLQK